MRHRGPSILVACLSILSSGQASANGAGDRDFVFTDEEGHLVLRFAGSPSGALTQDQTDEIVNVQLSTMVHDRLRADSVFEADPVDAAWADGAEAAIETHLASTAPVFTRIDADCRTAGCRVILDHPTTWTVAAHQSLMTEAQSAIEALVESVPGSFEPAFLIAAHYQEPQSPYMKLFLQRADTAPNGD